MLRSDRGYRGYKGFECENLIVFKTQKETCLVYEGFYYKFQVAWKNFVHLI